MKTLYIAAEKLVTWNDNGQLAVNDDSIEALMSHVAATRFIVCFAPSRFGLLFEDRRELHEAWSFIETALRRSGFTAHHTILFERDADVLSIMNDAAEFTAGEQRPVFFTDDPQDLEIAQCLNMKCISEIPVEFSGTWRKIQIRRALKTIVAAALNP